MIPNPIPNGATVDCRWYTPDFGHRLVTDAKIIKSDWSNAYGDYVYIVTALGERYRCIGRDVAIVAEAG